MPKAKSSNGSKRKVRRRRKRYHVGTYDSPKAGTVKYRSGWENKYMEFLDSDPDVLSWEYEPFKIPYLSNKTTGKIRQYNPDFVVTRTSGKFVVEIKPRSRLKSAKVQKKIAAAEAWCKANNVVFCVVTEVELKSLGLL